jgi:pyrroloquinoline-quinone synthase
MNRLAELEARIARYDLNTHPFYRAWRAGTLPAAKLAQYSGEYEPFIGAIARGWDAVDKPDYADEERAHAALWASFRSALGANASCENAESRDLVATAERLFTTRPDAIGALYAFESQQPRTAQSKLDGLNAHYALDDAGKRYFEVHAGDVHESVELGAMAETLDEREFARAADACETMCRAMWRALDGVYAGVECAAPSP